jgi:hypothetical protein
MIILSERAPYPDFKANIQFQNKNAKLDNITQASSDL